MTLARPWWRRNEPPNCKDVGRVLQSYLDGVLDDGDAIEVSAHLDACRDCGLEAHTYNRIKAALARPSDQPPDPAVIERLRRFSEELTEG